ncbi:hypothetical protein [Ketobacter nezhaii]|uniref:hypothetical protein n=1 Tax=Ketobacter sp. MCCC 1A13808 TaxID=2602738 RepID=UPI0018DDA2DF|nr:hypothetical protein [Ketobacter sp. MCCC 1A13808]
MESWYGLIVIAVVGLAAVSTMIVLQNLCEKRLIKGGILPHESATTDEDIVRLANSVHKILAIKRYRQIYTTSLKVAKSKVEAMVIE